MFFKDIKKGFGIWFFFLVVSRGCLENVVFGVCLYCKDRDRWNDSGFCYFKD